MNFEPERLGAEADDGDAGRCVGYQSGTPDGWFGINGRGGIGQPPITANTSGLVAKNVSARTGVAAGEHPIAAHICSSDHVSRISRMTVAIVGPMFPKPRISESDNARTDAVLLKRHLWMAVMARVKRAA